MSGSRTAKRKNNLRHYAMFNEKTLCGLIAVAGEEVLSPRTNCMSCLKEAITMHFQLSNFAAQLLKEDVQ